MFDEKKGGRDMEDLLNVSEAAQALRVSRHTIRAWTIRKKIAVIKLGRRCLYRRQDLESLIKRSLQPAEEEDQGGEPSGVASRSPFSFRRI
jgi:excisionase family DNA binding protein